MTTPVSQSDCPPNEAYTKKFAYDSTPSLQYLGWAKSVQPTYTYSVADATITNIVVSTNVGTVTAPTHGLIAGNRVTLAGWTEDLQLNGTYVIQSAADGNTFTITTASVADDTYVDAGGTITTHAPRTSAACWAIQRKVYNATPLNTAICWCEGIASERFVWDSRTSYAYD